MKLNGLNCPSAGTGGSPRTSKLGGRHGTVLALDSVRLPKRPDRRELAEFVPTTMEGGVMQAFTHYDVA